MCASGHVRSVTGTNSTRRIETPTRCRRLPPTPPTNLVETPPTQPFPPSLHPSNLFPPLLRPCTGAARHVPAHPQHLLPRPAADGARVPGPQPRQAPHHGPDPGLRRRGQPRQAGAAREPPPARHSRQQPGGDHQGKLKRGAGGSGGRGHFARIGARAVGECAVHQNQVCMCVRACRRWSAHFGG